MSTQADLEEVTSYIDATPIDELLRKIYSQPSYFSVLETEEDFRLPQRRIRCTESKVLRFSDLDNALALVYSYLSVAFERLSEQLEMFELKQVRARVRESLRSMEYRARLRLEAFDILMRIYFSKQITQSLKVRADCDDFSRSELMSKGFNIQGGHKKCCLIHCKFTESLPAFASHKADKKVEEAFSMHLDEIFELMCVDKVTSRKNKTQPKSEKILGHVAHIGMVHEIKDGRIRGLRNLIGTIFEPYSRSDIEHYVRAQAALHDADYFIAEEHIKLVRYCNQALFSLLAVLIDAQHPGFINECEDVSEGGKAGLSFVVDRENWSLSLRKNEGVLSKIIQFTSVKYKPRLVQVG